MHFHSFQGTHGCNCYAIKSNLTVTTEITISKTTLFAIIVNQLYTLYYTYATLHISRQFFSTCSKIVSKDRGVILKIGQVRYNKCID